MKILVTGAGGFVGQNLVQALSNIRDGKDRTHAVKGVADPKELVIYELDTDSAEGDLDRFCADCDFVFHFAGVNRPETVEEFMEGNYLFTKELVKTLTAHRNYCPLLFASSVQASLTGRFEDSEYGKSKLYGEEAVFEYGLKTGARVMVYRFPNVFGKWSRPNYNSAVATFCHNIANDLPIRIDDPDTRLELLYIDDLIGEMILALNGEEHRCVFDRTVPVADEHGKHCYVPVTHTKTLGEIAALLTAFKEQPGTMFMPEIEEGSFAKKLFSAYLSFVPKEKMRVPLKMNRDERGSFTEILKTKKCGQVSVNICRPGVTKGEHWHHSKWEIFIVVSGHGLIQERKLGTDEIVEYEVSGEKLEAIYMLPGYTHNLINLSKTDDLITLIWINEEFDPEHPDTYREYVKSPEQTFFERDKTMETALKTDYTDVSFQNNGKLKLLIIVGTRPEIIRLAATIQKCRKYFDCLLAHTGQNYDYNLSGIFFRDLKLDDPDVYMNAVGEDLGETLGNIISCSYKLMKQVQPDALLILGDTNSCLSAMAAKRLHIPIFHMEAGNRCKDERLPEESNRKIVDIISDVNMVYSDQARNYLMECGFPRERIFKIGSPMAEVLHQNLDEIEKSDILARLNLEAGKYILLSAHREENIDDPESFESLFTAINALAEKYDMPILYSCHPRSRNRLQESGFKLDGRVIRHEPLGFHDYNHLQMNAFAVVSDSGTLPEESSFYTSVGHAFPAVCIRTSTERPEALDKAGFILAGIDRDHLLQAVDTAVEMVRNGDNGTAVPEYQEENVSTKAVKIIQSYTGVIDKMVWRKK